MLIALNPKIDVNIRANIELIMWLLAPAFQCEGRGVLAKNMKASASSPVRACTQERATAQTNANQASPMATARKALREVTNFSHTFASYTMRFGQTCK